MHCVHANAAFCLRRQTNVACCRERSQPDHGRRRMGRAVKTMQHSITGLVLVRKPSNARISKTRSGWPESVRLRWSAAHDSGQHRGLSALAAATVLVVDRLPDHHDRDRQRRRRRFCLGERVVSRSGVSKTRPPGRSRHYASRSGTGPDSRTGTPLVLASRSPLLGFVLSQS